jgi:predicted nucleic acid-binding protein
MFDSNIFDDLVSGNMSLNLFNTANIKVYLTHIQIDEINNCKDLEKRAKLFLFMIELNPKKIATESFILGTSRIGSARLSDGNIIEILRGGNLKHTNDALIDETAIKNNLILITNDLTFQKKVEGLGGVVMNVKQLKDSIT